MEITKALMDPMKAASPKVLVEGRGYSMNLFLRVGGDHSISLLQDQGLCRAVAPLCCGSQFLLCEKKHQQFSFLTQLFLR